MKKNTFLIVLAYWMQCLGLFATELENLKVEYATCPMGIDVSTPRFSWQMKAGENEYGIRHMESGRTLIRYGCMMNKGPVSGIRRK